MDANNRGAHYNLGLALRMMGKTVGGATALLVIPVEAGRSYLVQLRRRPNVRLPFETIDGSPAVAPKGVGERCIGLVETPGYREQ